MATRSKMFSFAQTLYPVVSLLGRLKLAVVKF